MFWNQRGNAGEPAAQRANRELVFGEYLPSKSIVSLGLQSDALQPIGEDGNHQPG